MEGNHKKDSDNLKENKSDDSKESRTCSSPKDIPNVEAARNRNFVAVGSPGNVFSSILAGMIYKNWFEAYFLFSLFVIY